MRKKNIILIAIALVVVVVCILAAVIGFGINKEDDEDNDKKAPVELSDSTLAEDETESKEENVDVETEPPKENDTEEESQESSDETVDEGTESETTNDSTQENSTEEESTEEMTEEQTTIEVETTEQTTVSEEELNRLSYEYMMVDGKSVYVEYNERLLELFNCINAERKKAGKSELEFSRDICFVACARASQIAYEKDFDSDGMEYYELMEQNGISFSKAVENIAAGHNQAESVVAGDDASWKTSITHYENMVSDEYTKVGVGVDYSDTLGYIWVAIFSN